MNSLSPPRILVIDDEASLRTVFSYALSSDGFATDSANGPEESLAKMTSFDPELILVDLKMPLMNGIEVAKMLRENGYQHSFAICSAFIANDLLNEAFGLGIVDFVPKPTTPDILRGVVQRIFDSKSGTFPNVFEEVRHLIRVRDFAKAKTLCEEHLSENEKDKRLEDLLPLVSHHLEGSGAPTQPVDISTLLL